MSHPTPWEPKSPLEQRASHEDRDRISDILRIAAGDGRLSLEELEERLEACYAARTYADLAPLVADLPGQALVRQPPQPPRPKDVVRTKRVGGNLRCEGTWLVPKRLEAEVRGGSVVLDFTSATVTEPVTEVHVTLRGGNLRLIVPAGHYVDAAGVEIRGGSVARRRAADQEPDAPVVHRIVVTGRIVGGSVVIVPPRPPRRPGRLRRMLGRGR
ncbi:DUF1707 domain-containing protein [Streptomyces sp. NPDC058691]|uniref:DUF1707 SHOCT-like domain-containing protein n=1 Tax=Streptomyces sp. NPDC058691 TaxID=3346601 RepID=UPI003657B757